MRAEYIITPSDRPWVVQYTAADLEEIAAALVAQPNPGALAVYVNDAGFSRELRSDERELLAGFMARA